MESTQTINCTSQLTSSKCLMEQQTSTTDLKHENNHAVDLTTNQESRRDKLADPNRSATANQQLLGKRSIISSTSKEKNIEFKFKNEICDSLNKKDTCSEIPIIYNPEKAQGTTINTIKKENHDSNLVRSSHPITSDEITAQSSTKSPPHNISPTSLPLVNHRNIINISSTPLDARKNVSDNIPQNQIKPITPFKKVYSPLSVLMHIETSKKPISPALSSSCVTNTSSISTPESFTTSTCTSKCKNDHSYHQSNKEILVPRLAPEYRHLLDGMPLDLKHSMTSHDDVDKEKSKFKPISGLKLLLMSTHNNAHENLNNKSTYSTASISTSTSTSSSISSSSGASEQINQQIYHFHPTNKTRINTKPNFIRRNRKPTFIFHKETKNSKVSENLDLKLQNVIKHEKELQYICENQNRELVKQMSHNHVKYDNTHPQRHKPLEIKCPISSANISDERAKLRTRCNKKASQPSETILYPNMPGNVLNRCNRPVKKSVAKPGDRRGSFYRQQKKAKLLEEKEKKEKEKKEKEKKEKKKKKKSLKKDNSLKLDKITINSSKVKKYNKKKLKQDSQKKISNQNSSDSIRIDKLDNLNINIENEAVVTNVQQKVVENSQHLQESKPYYYCDNIGPMIPLRDITNKNEQAERFEVAQSLLSLTTEYVKKPIQKFKFQSTDSEETPVQNECLLENNIYKEADKMKLNKQNPLISECDDNSNLPKQSTKGDIRSKEVTKAIQKTGICKLQEQLNNPGTQSQDGMYVKNDFCLTDNA